ncbi:MAG: aminoacyl--tRNA ligase-related protein [Bryobacteraceae bacterium]
MHELEIAISRPVPATLVEEVEKKSVYISRHLQALKVADSGSLVRLTIDERAHAAETQDKVQRFIAAMLKGYRKFERKIVYKNTFDPRYTDNVWEEAQQRDWVFDAGLGQVSLRGPAFGLFQYFEHTFREMAEKQFRADERRFPTLIPAHVLGRVGYFSSFPQAITFVSHLHEDFDLLDEFQRANKEGPLTFPQKDVLDQPHHCLTPVVCYHCYRMLENQIIPANEVRSFTAVGSCFRYESRNTTSLERLWDFTLREFIFVGSREGVKQKRQESMDAVKAWVEELELAVTFETASDPFFTADFSEKTYFQLLSDLKYEMRVNLAPDRTIAAGSFNLHNDFFGKTFQIRSGDSTAFSSCVGFGIERWICAFLAQKGFDVKRWPEQVQPFIKSES